MVPGYFGTLVNKPGEPAAGVDATTVRVQLIGMAA